MLRDKLQLRLSPLCAGLMLIVIGLGVFANSFSGAFVFDDLSFVNKSVLGGDSWEWLLADDESPIKGRPLVGLTFVLNYAVSGEHVGSYHLVNIGVHLACAVALFAVIYEGMKRFAPEAMPGVSRTGFAFACSLIWMVHPLQTECVNYLSQRTESMAALCMLTALYCAIRSDEKGRRASWLFLAGAASWAAAFCKEIAAVGPVLIVLFDLTFRDGRIKERFRREWPLYLAAFSSWIPVATLMYCLPRSATVGANGSVTVLQYALNQAVMIVQYLKLTVWPDALLIDYGRPWQASWLEAAPAALAVLLLLVLTVVVYRRKPAIGFLGVWVFLLLAPTSSLIPVNTEVGAERRMYLPLAALAILSVAGVSLLVKSFNAKFARRSLDNHHSARGTLSSSLLPPPASLIIFQVAALCLIAMPLAARTVARNEDYRSPVGLWTQAVHQRPQNHRAWGNLALAWQQFDLDTGARVFHEITRRWPDDPIAQFEVAATHRMQGKFEDAIRCYRRTVELDPDHGEARRRLAWLLAACDDEKLRDGTESLRLAQSLVVEHPTSIECLDVLAAAQAESGDFLSAMKTMQLALERAKPLGGNTVGLQHRLWLYQQDQPCRFGPLRK